MLNEKKSKRGTVIALLCALALLALVVLLENTMKPTGMLFTVLKKGAVYALVAVSMNLLNGFTGLFSLGQAGFMLLALTPTPFSPYPRRTGKRCTISITAPP